MRRVDESENTTAKGFNHKHVGVASLSCRKIMTTPSSPSPPPLLPKDDVFSRSNGSGLVNTLDGVRRKIKSLPKKAKKRSLTEKDAQSNPWHLVGQERSRCRPPEADQKFHKQKRRGGKNEGSILRHERVRTKKLDRRWKRARAGVVDSI